MTMVSGAMFGTAVIATALTFSACSSDGDTEADNTPSAVSISAAPGTLSVDANAGYAAPGHWVCRPDIHDVCDGDISITEMSPSGAQTVRRREAAVAPPVDCFYLYHTTSEDHTLNSDFVAGDELDATRVEAAPFSDICRLYAPLYRSVTVAGLSDPSLGDKSVGYDRAFADVLDAWRYYLANDNDRRAVILIGHSQGSAMLARLLRDEIDPDPDQRALIVSAFLAGPPDLVPDRYILHDDLEHLPPCRAIDETGCVVAFSTFRKTSPPPPDSRFAHNRGTDGRSGCVNPAAPQGGQAVLSAAFASGPWALTEGSIAPPTPFMDLPGLITAQCVHAGNYTYLEITIAADPSDARADDIPGDLTPEWGLHLMDVEITAGSLHSMAAAQIRAFVG